MSGYAAVNEAFKLVKSQSESLRAAVRLDRARQQESTLSAVKQLPAQNRPPVEKFSSTQK